MTDEWEKTFIMLDSSHVKKDEYIKKLEAETKEKDEYIKILEAATKHKDDYIKQLLVSESPMRIKDECIKTLETRVRLLRLELEEARIVSKKYKMAKAIGF
jgi:hypothetical protein